MQLQPERADGAVGTLGQEEDVRVGRALDAALARAPQARDCAQEGGLACQGGQGRGRGVELGRMGSEKMRARGGMPGREGEVREEGCGVCVCGGEGRVDLTRPQPHA